MRVKVARYTDNNPADVIVEPLLSTEPAMVERGRNELDEQQFSRLNYRIALPLDLEISPGDIVEVSELAMNEVWRGKVESVDIQVSDSKMSQTISVDRIIL